MEWQFFLEVLVGGLLAGVMYSLVALGFVLIYKASGVFNFAQGAMVFFAALTCVSLTEFGLPLWLAIAGVAVSYWFYMISPAIPAAIARTFRPIVTILENKYYMDWFNENVLARGARMIGTGLWKGGDQGVIDGVLINGSARTVGGIAGLVRLIQTGHLYWYALVMILGVVGLMTWQLWPYMGPQFKALFGL